MAPAPGLMVMVDSTLQPTPALMRAAAIARKSSERLLLALFEFDRVLARAAHHGFDLDAYLNGRRQKLEALAGPLRAEGLNVNTRLFWGRPPMARMLLAVLTEQPRMVFKDIQAEPATKRLEFLPEDLDLLRQCPAPLMLTRTGARALPERILAAVDPLDEHVRPHELNARVLKAANQLAMQCDARLDVVHAFEFMPPPMDGEYMTAWLPDFSLAEELRGLHLHALQQLAREYRVPPAQLHLLDGRPDQVIAEFAAAQKCDVVVMGTVQRNFLQRLALGSVAEGLLKKLDCDLLALKPEGFNERLRADLVKVNLDND
ncbi:MAG: universal stress protein [Gammaproteobacteria bacterium]